MLLGLAVPGLLASFTQLPLQTDRPVEAIELPDGYDRMLVFFGYVDCPQVCPTAMARLQQIYGALDRTHSADRLGVTFVNLTEAPPDVAVAYAKAFHPAFEGVQAGPRARGGLMREFGVRFERDADSPAGWHTDSAYLMQRTPAGWRLRAVVPRADLRERTIRGLLSDLAARSDRT